MPWSDNTDINFNSSFTFNQTSNNLYLKILYASFSASNISYTNSDMIFYTLALAFLEKKFYVSYRAKAKYII